MRRYDIMFATIDSLRSEESLRPGDPHSRAMVEIKEKEGSPLPESVCGETRLSVESSSGVCSEASEASGEADMRRATLL